MKLPTTTLLMLFDTIQTSPPGHHDWVIKMPRSFNHMTPERLVP